METHATIAWWQRDKLTVYDATQYISGVKTSLAKSLSIPVDNVRVIDPLVGGGVMPLLSPILPRGPIGLCRRLRGMPDDVAQKSLAELPGWTVLHTPGHTPGHLSLFREGDRTLLVGDAFCTTKPESFFEANLLQHPELHGTPAYFTSNWRAAEASVKKLADLNPATVAPGHGKPLSGEDVAPSLRALAQHFEQIAVPDNRT